MTKKELLKLYRWLGTDIPNLEIANDIHNDAAGYMNFYESKIVLNRRFLHKQHTVICLIHEYIHYIGQKYKIKGYKIPKLLIYNGNNKRKVKECLQKFLFFEQITELLAMLIYIEYCKPNDLDVRRRGFCAYLSDSEKSMINWMFDYYFK